MIHTLADIPYRHSSIHHIKGGRGVVLDGHSFRGVPKDGGFWGYGLHLEGCEGVTLRRCDFRELAVGLVVRNCRRVLIEACDFSLIQSDGIKLIGSHEVVIRTTSLSDFNPGPLDHPDLLQAHGGDCSDVLVADNLGYPGRATQGFWFSNPVGAGHAGVRVERNLLIGLMHNVISVAGPGGVAEGNTVLLPPGHPYKPQINGVTGVNDVRSATAAEIEAAVRAWRLKHRPDPLVEEVRAWIAQGQSLLERVEARG